MVRGIIIFVVFSIFINCTTIHNKKQFTLLNHEEKNIKLKTNGYYYSVYNRDSISTKNSGKGIYMKILLNNNTFHNVGNGYGDDCGKIIELDCEIKKSEKMLYEYQKYTEKRKRGKNYDIWDWGKFSTKNDTIKLQWFYNKFGQYYLIEEIGEIIDSTSFKLVRGIDYGEKTSWNMDRVYIFKPFDVEKMYEKTPLFNEIIDTK
ncbi:hypothetical protein SY27_10275 [Flavobacterium sp. 316]|uniref:hypothetical protein n=1 Tax=Flavobacterium sp. 316 TaxID=1603293 RepID=UPI0005DDDD16|nr:hypothetical protein [Flavobacterium sp. 316]KIX21139.1 hypothetical protein SY27_10275 [Flavobacterium sp. 316]